MGGQSSIIDTSNIPYESLKPTTQIQKRSYCPPFRKFNNQTIKIENKNIQASIQIIEPYHQNIIIKQQIYTDMQDAFDEKTKNILLNYAIHDDLYTDIFTYIGENDGKDVTLQIRPFKKYNTYLFDNLVYQLWINEQVAKLKCPKLNTVIDNYIIQTGLQGQDQQKPNSQILVLQPINTNLSEIIRYRRQNKWPWTTQQFNVLAFDLCEGLNALHDAKITHNDIRPCNIFYSSNKNCFQLASFKNAIVSYDKNMSGSAMDRMTKSQMRTSVFYGDPQINTIKQANLQSGDIFSLGMTLLSAFYLFQPIQLKSVQNYNSKLESKYSIMQLINKILLPVDKRINIKQLLKQIPSGQRPKGMKNMIQSLKFKNAPKQKRLVVSKKVISQGYQRLGLWDQWKQNLYTAYQLQQNQIDDYKKANSLFDLAKIQYCRDSIQLANIQAKQASKLFRDLGYSAYDQGNINQSVVFFTKAIQCSKYFSANYDIDVAKNLQGLALIHSEKGQYQLSKPLIKEASTIVIKNVGKNTMDYCKIRMSQAKIQSDFGQFQLADQILQQCLSISLNIEKQKPQQGQKLRAQVLHELGRTAMLQSQYNNNRQVFIIKAQKYLSQSLILNQKYPNNQIQLASNYETFGQIQLRKQNYIAARIHFKKVQELRDSYAQLLISGKITDSTIGNSKSKNNNSINIIRQKQKAQNLSSLAACQNGLNNTTLALKYYNQSLQIYRKLYGSDHNKYSAIVIGNMSKVYAKLNQKAKSTDCINLACQILEDLLGEDDPDYQHFRYLKESGG